VVFNHQFQGISQRIIGHNGDHIALHEFLGRPTIGRFTHHIDLSNRDGSSSVFRAPRNHRVRDCRMGGIKRSRPTTKLATAMPNESIPA
jgi:hypothetical protein